MEKWCSYNPWSVVNMHKCSFGKTRVEGTWKGQQPTLRARQKKFCFPSNTLFLLTFTLWSCDNRPFKEGCLIVSIFSFMTMVREEEWIMCHCLQPWSCHWTSFIETTYYTMNAGSSHCSYTCRICKESHMCSEGMFAWQESWLRHLPHTMICLFRRQHSRACMVTMIWFIVTLFSLATFMFIGYMHLSVVTGNSNLCLFWLLLFTIVKAIAVLL